ncbi:MAG: 5-formyltetrahydrofolate cyclo-ligase [Pseudomonadota bacterium]
MTLTEDKAGLRKALYKGRALAHANATDAALRATSRLIDRIGPARGRIIAGYRPIRSEIDPTTAMVSLHQAGARICVPVIEAAGAPLRFREWTPDSEMIVGAFGAEVPAHGDWLEPEVLIVPLVGWDRQGWRLGYGGGFYDRTLEGLRGTRPTVAIGFAYAAQEVRTVPTEPTDQRLDAIVTEAETVEIAS